MVRDSSGAPLAYVKHTGTGELLKLSAAETGDMRYIAVDNNTLHAYIDGQLYEITGK
jgi:hypothetical protein